MNKIKSILIITICSILLCSCNSLGEDSLVGINNNLLNKKISLSVIQEWTSYNKSDVVGISIYNTSNKNVTIPYDEGIKIFAFYDNEWVEINQKYDESYQEDQRDVVFYPGDFHPFAFMGDFPDSDEDLKIRIYVLGWIGDESNPVGAYIELILQ